MYVLMLVLLSQALHAHSQFCISGDHTLEATEHAIKSIADEEADEHFVIVLSDANFDRSAISFCVNVCVYIKCTVFCSIGDILAF